MKKIPQNIIDAAMSYAAYRELVDRKFVDGETTGPDNSDAMLEYTRLNISRMRRLDKTTRLTEETLGQLARIQQSMTWLVLTEGWCGDAAQIIPVLAHMAAQNDHIDLKLVLRDQNLELMDAFLTNGGRSIPKVIFLDTSTHEVIGSWGPRPVEVQEKTMAIKAHLSTIEDPAERKAYDMENKKQIQLWYAKDKTKSIQQEVLEALFEQMVAI